MTICQALMETARRLAASETAGLDAQVLLAHLLGRPRAWLLAHLEQSLAEADVGRLELAIQRLEAGEPLPYLLGHWEFFGLDFLVGPEALIPRPETELLVEAALAWLRNHPKLAQPRAIDIGTGSGCIAVSLATKYDRVHILATDRSLPALRLARRNAARHGVQGRVHFVQASLLTPFAGVKTGQPLTSTLPTFHLICANLPYIPTGTLDGLAVARAEPRLALDGGPDGLDPIRGLLQQVLGRLARGGRLLLEIEASQGPAVLALAQSVLPSARASLWADLAGRDRLVCVDN